MKNKDMKFSLEYVWIGGNHEFRSKIKIIHLDHELTFADLPVWNFDGSSTNQADSEDTEVMLRPVKVVPSPFVLAHCTSYLVLCETYSAIKQVSEREKAKQIFDTRLDLVPWFGLEQEYIMLGKNIPNDIQNQGAYYCGVGHGKYALERQIALEHLDACLFAGLEISGINAEVAHCQWEYQIGPCVGIDAGDQILLSRYMLERVAEKYDVAITYAPKPFPNINGSGCHVNFSTEPMRQEKGLQVIEEAIRTLESHHEDIIAISGENNHTRLTGHHETSSMHTFSWGVGTRHTSIRIPNQVFVDGKGYFEDRRCAANMSPYVVTSTLFQLCK
jgi:glutamine synthetase